MTVVYNPRTKEGQKLYENAVWTASVTGRLSFGQLWFVPPSVDDILFVAYSASIKALINQPSILWEKLHGKQITSRESKGC